MHAMRPGDIKQADLDLQRLAVCVSVVCLFICVCLSVCLSVCLKSTTRGPLVTTRGLGRDLCREWLSYLGCDRLATEAADPDAA